MRKTEMLVFLREKERACEKRRKDGKRVMKHIERKKGRRLEEARKEGKARK